MRVFGALVWREIAERRLLLLTSACLGLVPLVLPFLPGRPERFSPEEIRTATTLVLLLLFGGAGILILGATIVGRDLSEGRLGFYFSRPVSGWTLWWSRLAAALALVLASLVLIAAPSAAVDRDEWSGLFSSTASDRAWPILASSQEFFSEVTFQTLPGPLPVTARATLVLAAILTLLALAHAVSTLVRARSVWVLADLAGLAVVAALVWSARDRLVTEQALGALVWVERAMIPAVLAALLVAGVAQLTRGRTDLALGHRFLSAVLWPLLIAGALALGGYARWVTGGDVRDLESVAQIEASPSQEWLFVGGRMKGRAGTTTTFLLDARSGEAWRLGSLAVAGPSATFSAAGHTAVWLRCESYRPFVCRAWSKDLSDPGSAPRSTGVEIDYRPIHLAASADGSRLAVAGARRLAVYELSSGRILGAVAAYYAEAVTFLSRDRLRFHEPYENGSDWVTRIRQLDLSIRRETETGRLPRGIRVARDPAADVLLFRRYFPSGMGLYRGGTGELLADVHHTWSRVPSAGYFLADGRLLTSDHDGETLILRVLGAAGEEQQRVERRGAGAAAFAGEISPGRVLVALEGAAPAPGSAALGDLGAPPLTGWSTHVLDAGSGALEPLAGGAVPLGAPRDMPRQRLFLAGGGAVLRVDLAGGQARTVLPAPGEASSPVDLVLR